MNAAYLMAAIPEPCRVLGLKLKPFSLGHYLLMHRFDCAYVTGERVSIGDLFLGVFICAHTFEDNLRLFDSSVFWKLMHQWRSAVYGVWPFRVFKPRKVDLHEKSTLFRDYFEQGIAWPKFFYDDQSKAVSHGAPLVQEVKLTLMRELHFSETEVMNRPMALSLWDYVTLGELNGRVRIFDEVEHKTLQEGADKFDVMIRSKAKPSNVT